MQNPVTPILVGVDFRNGLEIGDGGIEILQSIVLLSVFINLPASPGSVVRALPKRE